MMFVGLGKAFEIDCFIFDCVVEWGRSNKPRLLSPGLIVLIQVIGYATDFNSSCFPSHSYPSVPACFSDWKLYRLTTAWTKRPNNSQMWEMRGPSVTLSHQPIWGIHLWRIDDANMCMNTSLACRLNDESDNVTTWKAYFGAHTRVCVFMSGKGSGCPCSPCWRGE